METQRKGALFLVRLVQPRMADRDERRREFILNTVLVGAVLLLFAAVANNTFKLILDGYGPEYNNNALTITDLLSALAIFVFLYLISRKGFPKIAAFLLVAMFFCLSFNLMWRWSIELPAASLLFVITIILAGVIFNSRMAYFVTVLAAASVIGIEYLHLNQIVQPNLYWKYNETSDLSDAVVMAFVFLLVATISWLSNRETEKSLERARKSEADLRRERDSLETRVEEKTHELRRVQREKMMQIHRFAEFGRISSGLLHDLANPITALSLYLEIIKTESDNRHYKEIEGHLNSINTAATHIKKLFENNKKMISNEEISENFCPNGEILEAVDLLAFKAKKNGVDIKFKPQEELCVTGNPTQFSQIVTNLTANAIDAYPPFQTGKNLAPRQILIELVRRDGKIILKVTDWGSVIPATEIKKIFDPFYTTKKREGMGIGLPLAKEMAEKGFGGTITASSSKEAGTVFCFEFTAKK